MSITILMTETISVLRPRAGGEYVKGRYVPSEYDSSTAKASVQPATGEKLENVDENERTRETVYVFLTKELFTADTSPLLRPDIVLYNGKKFEVTRVERWAGLLPHFKVEAEQLLDDGEET